MRSFFLRGKHLGLALCDSALDYDSRTAPTSPRAIQKIGGIDLGLPNRGNGNLQGALRAGFENRVPPIEVLQSLAEGLPAVKGLRDLGGIA
jgi:hypothetical protein